MNEYKDKIKSYHIFLLSCLLASLMILNSNNVNYQKQELKSQKEKEEFFSEMIKIRKLSGGNSNTEEVCSRADDDLIDYYKTGDLSKIDLDDEPIKCEDKDKSYMKTLIDIVREMSDDSSSNAVDGSRLRNLGSLDTNKLVDYLMRILPFLIFLVFGVLSIFGWIICCICCCCDCCCCCCCKKESCKVPCFIFTFVFYALSVAISIYGLTQSKKIFVGLANTECSILKFFGQVLDGEIKQERPKWGGIDNINILLQDLINQLNTFSHTTVSEIDSQISSINTAKSNFHGQMDVAGGAIDTASNDITKYRRDYSGITIQNFPYKDRYILDVAKGFGKRENTGVTPIIYTQDSTLYQWNREFSIVSENADENIRKARDGLDDIVNRIEPIRTSLNNGITNLNKITNPFRDAEKEFGSILGKYSGHIDKYGKMSVTIVFSVLMVINIGLAALMLLIYFFSTKTCAGCCCMRCLFKFCTHILWNVLSLMIILSFIIGSILGLFGRIGGDMMSLVTYIMSEDNFNDPHPLILNKIKGDAKDYIRRCIHGDGNIVEQLGLDTSLDSFNDINTAELQVTTARAEFSDIKEHCYIYEALNQKLQQEASIDGNTQLIPVSSGTIVKYNEILKKINEEAKGKIRWDVQASKDLDCNQVSSTETTTLKPIKCKPYNQQTGESPLFQKYSEILKGIDEMVSYANDLGKSDSVKKVINGLRDHYRTFLGSYDAVLVQFLSIIQRITRLVRRYSGDDDLFSFLNGKFIGTNLKIILKYLKYSLGVDLYTVGVMLIVVGCSLALSVSSTIILIVIINIELKKNQDARAMSNTGMVPEYMQNPQEVVSYGNNKI